MKTVTCCKKFEFRQYDKDLRAFARAALPVSPRHPFAGDAPLAKHRKTLAGRAGEAKGAFLQVFRNPFPLFVPTLINSNILNARFCHQNRIGRGGANAPFSQ
jgi:hypothetical protein